MADLFTLENLLSLCMLVLLQAVLGFDNLLYISLESKNAPEEKQPMVRMIGIGGAIFLRIGLLFVLVKLIKLFQEPFLEMDNHILHTSMNVHSVIVLVGGVFILYTATKEIFHMFKLEEAEEQKEVKKQPVGMVIFWIVVMNLIFSFDSILSAMALTDNLWVMTIAIIIGGILMIWLSGAVSNFLKKNRLYEVLGLFILFVVGIMLVSEGGHLAHIKFFGFEITPMSKATFYFIIAILVLIDVVQGRYQKKLTAEKTALVKEESNTNTNTTTSTSNSKEASNGKSE